MVQALRNEALTIVNALGTGILETRALLSFMPRVCRHLLGEDLKLPSIATGGADRNPSAATLPAISKAWS